MYNPTPASKLAANGAQRGVPGWKPLQPLKPIELQNAGFVQQNFIRAKPSNFALWTVEEQLADSKMAESDGSDSGLEDAEVKSDGVGMSQNNSPSELPVSSLDAEAIEKIKNEAFALGVEEGQRMAQAAASEQAALEQANSMEALANQANQLLTNIEQAVLALQEKPETWHEPLKRLALHISEHMVLAELNLSGQAIERLVQRCLDEIDLHGQSQVLIELNPQDKSRLQEMAGDVMGQMQIQAVSTLQPGSVRVLVNDTQIEDLVQNRMQTLANSLLTQPEAWREQSVFFRQPLAQREGQAQDVPERVAYQEPEADTDYLDGDPHA